MLLSAFALVRIEPSCGNTGDSASDLRAIDKRFERDIGRATIKATIAQRYRKALPFLRASEHIKRSYKALFMRGKSYQ